MHERIELPAWTLDRSGWYGLAAALTLSDQENKWVKIPAKQQRAFGLDFGKQSVGLFGGELKITRSVAFGTDWDTRVIDPSSLRAPY